MARSLNYFSAVVLLCLLPCFPCFPWFLSAADVTVDKEKKAVVIAARIAPRKVLEQVYPIEVVACFAKDKGGEKAHETLVTVEAKPSEVHKALEELGLKAGKPADVQNEKPAEGPELVVSLELPREGGGTRKVAVGQVLIDTRTGKALGKAVRFRFTGSELEKADPNKPDTQYAADKTGTLIAIFPVTAKTVLQSTLSMKDEKFVKLEPDARQLPKEGTPVKLILEVAK